MRYASDSPAAGEGFELPVDNVNSDENLGIIAAGVSCGQSKPGVDLGSAALLGSGLIELLAGQPKPPTIWHDFTVHTYRDLGEPELVEHLESVSSASSDSSLSSTSSSRLKNPLKVSHATQCLSHQVYSHASKGRTVLTLGGDHSVAIGSVSGVSKACREKRGQSPALVWVDAHADINTPKTSNSGHIHGMPVAFLSSLVRANDDEPFGWLEDMRDGEEAMIEPSKIVYIGLRDVEPEEQKALDTLGIKHFSSADVQRLGIDQVMNETIRYVGPDAPIHLSFDIDVLDPSVAPATGTPVEDGLTLDQGKTVCRRLRQTGQVVAMDLVEVNPLEDEVENGEQAFKTVSAGLEIIRSAFGSPS